MTPMASVVSTKTKVEPTAFIGLNAFEQPLVIRFQTIQAEVEQNEKKVASLTVDGGHILHDIKGKCGLDTNKYLITRPGQSKPEAVGRFDAVIASFGLSRATGWRYLRAYQQYLKATNPVPSAITTMATSNGVLAFNSTDETEKTIATEALADAYLAAGQPSSPTPQQCMAIVADACERAEQAPSDALAKFQNLLSKAVEFAKENNLEPEVIHGSLESAIAVYFGMPEARVTREKAAIYRQGGNSWLLQRGPASAGWSGPPSE